MDAVYPVAYLAYFSSFSLDSAVGRLVAARASFVSRPYPFVCYRGAIAPGCDTDRFACASYVTECKRARAHTAHAARSGRQRPEAILTHA